MERSQAAKPDGTVLSQRFSDALAYTVELHSLQRRKISGVPYVSHLLAVASLVLDYGGDEDETIAALLHDAVEDQGGSWTREEIRRRFGGRVAAIVDGCSDADEHPKPPWKQRKQEHLESVARADASVCLVVAADKLHNARSILREYHRDGQVPWHHFHRGREGMLWYLRAMTDVLKQVFPSPLVDELDRVVVELESLPE